MNYDFSALSDIEFEQLVNKLLIGKTRVVEQYAEGRDNGIDGLVREISNDAHIQAKHYLRSGFNQLKNKIEKEELPKLQKKSIPCYVLATSLNLSQSQAETLRALIKTAVHDVIVLGAASINSLLDNDPVTLKSTVKLWAANAELVRRILKPANMNCFYELQSRWECSNNVFVRTPDVKNVVDSLEKNHVAVIAGEPGVGKTTLAEYISLLYYKEGFEVHFFEGEFSHDDYDLTDTEKKIIFYYDDFLGSTYYDCYSGKQDSLIVNFIKRVSKEPNKRFILTSRTNIIQKACLYSEKYQDYGLAKQAYIVNVGAYSRLTKARILYNHLRNSNVVDDEIAALIKNKKYWEILNHRNFNPRLIRFITKRENFDDSQQVKYLEFVRDSMNNPKEIWAKCFTKQLDVSQRLLVQLVVANGGRVQEDVLKSAYNKALFALNIKAPEQERNDYEYVLSVCLKSILRKDVLMLRNAKESFVSVFNPSVSDYVLPTILERDIIVKLCDTLGTVESINVIESNKGRFIDVFVVYGSLLNGCPKNVWSNAKIHLVRLLGYECGKVPELIEFAMTKTELITKENKTDFFFIVFGNIDKFDFSDFIRQYAERFCDDFEDLGSIWECYKDSPFAKDEVVAFLQKCVKESLKCNIESILLEKTEASECTSSGDVDYALEKFLNRIREDDPFLIEEEIDDIRDGVDSDRIVEENEGNLYYESDVDNIQKELDEDEYIEEMFSRLL